MSQVDSIIENYKLLQGFNAEKQRKPNFDKTTNYSKHYQLDFEATISIY